MMTTTTKPTAKPMSEESMINLLRNALVVAGQEMGDEGDHWPVINATVHSIMKTWEDVKIERNVDAEMKKHLYAQLEIMEKSLPDCTPEAREAIKPKLAELREVYDAYFTAPADGVVMVDMENLPPYLQRAHAILETLEDENV